MSEPSRRRRGGAPLSPFARASPAGPALDLHLHTRVQGGRRRGSPPGLGLTGSPRAQQSLSTSAATQCNYGTHAGRCVICGAAGAADAYYCKECVQLEKDRDGCPKIINLGSSKTDLFFRCDTRELLSVLRTLLRCSGTDTVSRSVSLSLGRVAIVSAWAVARKRASAFGGKTKLCRFSDGCDRVCAQRSRALPRLTRDGADR